MELNAFPDREFKITVIEILIKVKKVMHEEIENVNIDKQYQKALKRNQGAREHNSYNKKFPRGSKSDQTKQKEELIN